LFKLYEKSYPIMNIILEKLSLNKNELKFFKKKPYFNKLYTIPSVYVQFLYLFDVIKYISKKFFYKIFNKKYRWHVAYQFSESWKNIVLYKSKIIQNPKNRFLADPFVWEKNGEHFIFLEDYNFKQSKAKISVYKINKNKAIELGTALEENFHLSYPFLFSYNNELFMCPETLETNDIRIYKCLNFPLKWKLENILIKNIRAVDTNIFFKNKKWWLITNSNLKTNKDYQDQMYLFSNDNPLSSDWKNNTLNPILFNSRQTRNGGLIIDKDELYRVYQKNGFDFYGESLGISKIIDINQKIFKEKKLFSINANFYPNIRGIHTFNYKKGLVAIDFLKIQ